jgi:hypothetical protein
MSSAAWTDSASSDEGTKASSCVFLALMRMPIGNLPYHTSIDRDQMQANEGRSTTCLGCFREG